MHLIHFKKVVSQYAKEKIPFFFLIDFELQQPIVIKLEDTAKNGLLFNFHNRTTHNASIKTTLNTDLIGTRVKKTVFEDSFNNVMQHIKKGDSFLLNLTFPSELETKLQLEDIYSVAKAPYKLLYKDKFVVFSPECFIKIKGNTISTYPMKGTIDASLENAEELLLKNDKEIREHNTIVDLLRNDLSMVAHNVRVNNFRYVDRIKTNSGSILQTSSEIVGTLDSDWKKMLGEILIKLLPAGSVSGAPKKKTLEIIAANEITKRGYYTGVFGVFDGKDLDSAVAIRFIEKVNDKLYYRSGGGITAQSNLEDEYNELNQKIYVPTI